MQILHKVNISSFYTEQKKQTENSCSLMSTIKSQTFTLWGILTAVSEDIDFIDGTVGFKELPQLIF